MALTKGTLAVVGSTVLALATAAWIGQAPDAASPSLTIYRSPT